MSDVLDLAKELKAAIEEEPLVIEYRKVKSQIDDNEEIALLKKRIALAKLHKEDALHKELLDKYHNHPLVANYEYLSEEVKNLLASISQIVNKK